MSQGKYNQINICEVCANSNLESVLDLGFHPMCDDLIKIGDGRTCKEYPIEILFCKNCCTAHQRFQVPKEDLFPASYHYRSRFTADVINGMRELVNSCAEKFGDLQGKKVLDIGCNDGSLLDFFRQKGALTFGVEPTGAYLDAKEKGHITYGNYLSEDLSNTIVAEHGKLDLITFTNVFAHIEDLPSVLRALKNLTDIHTIIVIENHYLGSVLSGNQFDTFYHEHPRTYSYTSFTKMASTLGMKLLDVEFPARYGGNIRVFMGNSNCNSINSEISHEALLLREANFYEKFTALQENIKCWIISKRAFLNEYHNIHGKLKAKAFPGRAAILVKLLGLDLNLVSAVYEKPGSLKIGHYLPGTRIPIISDLELFADRDKSLPILNLAWHIPSEIRSYLKDHCYTGEIVDVLNNEDFSH